MNFSPQDFYSIWLEKGKSEDEKDQFLFKHFPLAGPDEDLTDLELQWIIDFLAAANVSDIGLENAKSLFLCLINVGWMRSLNPLERQAYESSAKFLAEARKIYGEKEMRVHLP